MVCRRCPQRPGRVNSVRRFRVGGGVSGSLLALMLVASGCGEVPTGPESTTSGGVKQYAAAVLPRVTQELPVLDDGHIEIPTPEGWSFASQSRGLITRFHLKGRTGVPQIIVKVEPAAGGPETVTADNVTAYAAQVQAELDAAVKEKKITLLETAKPLLLGTQPYARYVITGKLPGKELATIERQILRTTQGGRTYTIDLQVRSNELEKHRDHAYALAAGIKFHAGTASTPPATPAEPAAP